MHHDINMAKYISPEIIEAFCQPKIVENSRADLVPSPDFDASAHADYRILQLIITFFV